MTAGMVRGGVGWEGAGTGQPPSVRLSVYLSGSSCLPTELPQDLVLILGVGECRLPGAGLRRDASAGGMGVGYSSLQEP